jgi:hypothetical protein
MTKRSAQLACYHGAWAQPAWDGLTEVGGHSVNRKAHCQAVTSPGFARPCLCFHQAHGPGSGEAEQSEDRACSGAGATTSDGAPEPGGGAMLHRSAFDSVLPPEPPMRAEPCAAPASVCPPPGGQAHPAAQCPKRSGADAAAAQPVRPPADAAPGGAERHAAAATRQPAARLASQTCQPGCAAGPACLPAAVEPTCCAASQAGSVYSQATPGGCCYDEAPRARRWECVKPSGTVRP